MIHDSGALRSRGNKSNIPQLLAFKKSQTIEIIFITYKDSEPTKVIPHPMKGRFGSYINGVVVINGYSYPTKIILAVRDKQTGRMVQI